MLPKPGVFNVFQAKDPQTDGEIALPRQYAASMLPGVNRFLTASNFRFISVFNCKEFEAHLFHIVTVKILR